MTFPRVIPTLLLKGSGFVKTTKFEHAVYLGDAINIVKIFNEKEIDEIIVLDIFATLENRSPHYQRIKEIVSEAFMPVAYGGGITNLDEVKTLFRCGIEKVTINSASYDNYGLISEISKYAGSQSVVLSIDIKKNILGRYELFSRCGKVKVSISLMDHIANAVTAGAGEILINSIDKDGTMSGYDVNLIEKIAHSVDVPVIACGGARNISDFKLAVQKGASAVAAGSMFVFYGPHKAVLITYPEYNELKKLFID